MECDYYGDFLLAVDGSLECPECGGIDCGSEPKQENEDEDGGGRGRNLF
jgi:hypothetical protein